MSRRETTGVLTDWCWHFHYKAEKQFLQSVAMSSLPLISSCFCCRRAEARNRQLPPLRSVQAVLFDIDGTLADSDPLHYRAFREMLAEVCMLESFIFK
jgi:hypothetical protein